MTQAQLAWYRAMEEGGHLRQIRDRAELDRHLAEWQHTSGTGVPIGYVLSLEGADSLVTLSYLERAYGYGLRAVGPGHYGPGVYAHGTSASGDLGSRGRELLKEMERLGIILDVTHLCDESLRDALDHFGGSVWASYSNCRSLVPHHRQLSDDHTRELVRRDAMIGVALSGWMLVPGWVHGESTPARLGVSLSTVVDHIERICQIAGSVRHCGIGSDLDGGFGREQCPVDVCTIAEISVLADRLAERGYSAEDVALIMHGNVVRFLARALP
jgi:membrane dipeptidase